MRSPALNPASCAGLPSSTHWKQTETSTLNHSITVVINTTSKLLSLNKGLNHFNRFITIRYICDEDNTYPDHVVNGVDISVSHVNPNSSQGEAKPFPRAVDDNRRPEAGDTDTQVPAGRRVPGRGVGWQRQRRLGARGRSCWVICMRKKNYNSGMSKFLLRLKAILSIKNNKLYLLFLLPLLPIIK